MMPSVAPERLVASLDPHLVERQRWFRHKGSISGAFTFLGGWPVITDGWTYGHWLIVGVKVEQECARYQIPIVFSRTTGAEGTVLGLCTVEGSDLALVEGGGDPVMVRDFVSRINEPRGSTDARFRAVRYGEPMPAPVRVRPVGEDSSNTLVQLDDTLLLKLYRCLDAAGRREADLLSALARAGSDGIPAVYAVAQYDCGDGLWALALAQEWLADAVSAWSYLTDALSTGPGVDTVAEVRRMGEAVASVHRGLLSIGAREGSDDDVRALRERIEAQTDRLRSLARRADLPGLTDDLRAASKRAEELARRLTPARHVVCPVHGDLHLGQLLRREDRYYVLDFEGEPLASAEDRLAWHSPLKDVAGMMRSFDYAAAMARRQGAPDAEAAWEAWINRVEKSFLDAYASCLGTAVLADDRAYRLLSLYLIEKATYEIAYELGSRPDWLDIPLGGLRRVLLRPTNAP